MMDVETKEALRLLPEQIGTPPELEELDCRAVVCKIEVDILIVPATSN